MERDRGRNSWCFFSSLISVSVLTSIDATFSELTKGGRERGGKGGREREKGVGGKEVERKRGRKRERKGGG